jgi:phage tail tape-measure protein
LSYIDPLGLLTEAERQRIDAIWTTTGIIIGGTIGFIAGGGSGFATGPGAIVASPAGAIAGTTAGATTGGLLGHEIGTYLANKLGSDDSNFKCSKKRGGNKSGGGKKQVDDVAREFKMDNKTRHDYGKFIEESKRIDGMGNADNYSYYQLRILAVEFLTK